MNVEPEKHIPCAPGKHIQCAPPILMATLSFPGRKKRPRPEEWNKPVDILPIPTASENHVPVSHSEQKTPVNFFQKMDEEQKQAQTNDDILLDALLNMRLDHQTPIKHQKIEMPTGENAIKVINQHFEKLQQLQRLLKPQHTKKPARISSNNNNSNTLELKSVLSAPLVPYEYLPPNQFQVCLRKPYKLYEFQAEAIQWMIHVENRVVQNSNYHHDRTGGILALTMGKGKTLCAGTLTAHTIQQQRQERSCTLYICPLGIMDVARFEMEKFFGTQLKIMLYHPDYMKSKFQAITHEHFSQFDVIITNYDTLKSRSKNFSPFMTFKWFRIFLDESHTIQNKKTKSYQCTYSLISPRRWCMTGTPMPNGLPDLFHQLYFCGLNESMVGRTRMTKENMNKLQLHRFIHWPNDDEVKSSVELPPLHTEIVSFDLNPMEQKLHFYLINYSRQLFETSLSATTAQESKQKLSQINTSLFQGLMLSTAGYLLMPQAKQLTLGFGIHENHHHRQHANTFEDHHVFGMGSSPYQHQQQNGPAWIKMAMDPTDDPTDTADADDPVTTADFLSPHKEILTWIKIRSGTAGEQSTKMMKIVEKWKQVQQQDPGAKVIFFSSYASALQLTIQSLIRHVPGFDQQYIFVHGKSGGANVRNTKMQRFITDPSALALFATFQLAGRGYNFTCANHVFLIDCWWTSVRTQQAIGRIQRIGQIKPMYVTYFLANKSLDFTAYRKAQQKKELSDSIRQANKETKELSHVEIRSILYQNYVGDVEMTAAPEPPQVSRHSNSSSSSSSSSSSTHVPSLITSVTRSLNDSLASRSFHTQRTASSTVNTGSNTPPLLLPGLRLSPA